MNNCILFYNSSLINYDLTMIDLIYLTFRRVCLILIGYITWKFLQSIVISKVILKLFGLIQDDCTERHVRVPVMVISPVIDTRMTILRYRSHFKLCWMNSAPVNRSPCNKHYPLRTSVCSWFFVS